MSGEGINWLEVQQGGVIDFRLPGDPLHIPAETLSKRREAYHCQCIAAMRKQWENEDGTPRRRYPASRWRDYLRSDFVAED